MDVGCEKSGDELFNFFFFFFFLVIECVAV